MEQGTNLTQDRGSFLTEQLHHLQLLPGDNGLYLLHQQATASISGIHEMQDSWNTHMETNYSPSWWNCLNKLMIIYLAIAMMVNTLDNHRRTRDASNCLLQTRKSDVEEYLLETCQILPENGNAVGGER